MKAKLPQALWAEFEPIGDQPSVAAAQAAFGNAKLKPIYKFDKATRILSLDADFLQEGANALAHARDFAAGRRVMKVTDQMNRLYAVESVFTITGNHTYAADSLGQTGGVYNIGVAVSDNDGNSLNFTNSATVIRPPIVAYPNTVETSPSGTLTNALLCVFTEPDVTDLPTEFSAAIDWQNGTGLQPATITKGNGLFEVSASQTNLTPGDYTFNFAPLNKFFN